MLREQLNKLLVVFARFAADPEDGEEVRLKKIIGMGLLVMGALLYLCYGILFFWFNEPVAGFACFGGFLSFALGGVTYNITRHYGAHWNFWFVTHTMVIVLIHVSLGGFAASGMAIVWLLIFPLTTLAAYEPQPSVIMFLLVIIIFIALGFLQPHYYRPVNNLPQNIVTALFVLNPLLFSSMATTPLFFYVWRNGILSKLVQDNEAKIEALVLNILPKEIVAVLKNENRVVADQFDSTSILFADLVNFTPVSAEMTPTELVELLNDVYSYFDTIVEKYDLEKIKTIGDCYMVAAGVPRRRNDHATVITQLALEIRDYVRQHLFLGHQISFRIGINSGSVVAGVIGRKKFSYDLWGDAVNTASRMESHGAGGFIQITEATYNLIKNHFNCEPRGVINVKGKGDMNVWYVLERKA